VAGAPFPGPNNGYLPPHPLQQQLLQQQQQQLQQQQQQLQQQQLQQQQLQQQQQQLQGFPYQQQQLGFPPGHYHPSVTGMKTIQVRSNPFLFLPYVHKLLY
jgi:type II secretory pathway pseudopilin PulG